jgi:hypothetical protein
VAQRETGDIGPALGMEAIKAPGTDVVCPYRPFGTCNLQTIFWEMTVERLGYCRPGAVAVHHLDEQLTLPRRPFSYSSKRFSAWFTGHSETRCRLLHLPILVVLGWMILMGGVSYGGRQYRPPGCVTYRYQSLGETHIICDDGSSMVLRDGEQGGRRRVEVFRPPSRLEKCNPSDKGWPRC